MQRDEINQLAARIAGSGNKRITLTTQTASTLAHVLRVYRDILDRPSDEGACFTVDVWGDGRLLETLARCGSMMVGMAAFEQACVERPTYEVTLRQGIRVLKKRSVAIGSTSPPTTDAAEML